jgi:hypothetical protein
MSAIVKELTIAAAPGSVFNALTRQDEDDYQIFAAIGSKHLQVQSNIFCCTSSRILRRCLFSQGS